MALRLGTYFRLLWGWVWSCDKDRGPLARLDQEEAGVLAWPAPELGAVGDDSAAGHPHPHSHHV